MKPNRPFILCAVDFSTRAHDAATVAAKLALRRTESLQLVHACEPDRKTTLAAAAKYLEREVARLSKTGAKVESLVLKGRQPSAALLNYIRETPPTLAAVGSGIKGPIDRWAKGSFSERIAESSPVPTLVVRDPAAFERWDWTKDRLKILLALDFYASSDVVLRWAQNFQMTGPCDLVLCHVNSYLPTVAQAAALGEPANEPEVQLRLERELRKKVRDQIGDDASQIVVRAHLGNPGPRVVEIAREVSAQLIAVGAHQRTGLGRLGKFSISRQLLHEADMNVVCVPVTASLDRRDVHIPDFRRVLVTTDFSELGNSAVPFACAACCIGGLVRIIHVAAPGKRSVRRSGGRRTKDFDEQLRALIPRETAARCRAPEVEVIESRNVADAICAEAERFGADLVCLASDGLGASRALHGSVTKRVLKKIRRPLLVIRRPEE